MIDGRSACLSILCSGPGPGSKRCISSHAPGMAGLQRHLTQACSLVGCCYGITITRYSITIPACSFVFGSFKKLAQGLEGS